jgi:diacylglycerol kinase
MKYKNNFKIKISMFKLLQSFKFAGEGLISIFKTERNFRIEVIIASVVIIAMVVFPLRDIEIIMLILTIVSVLSMEILNTVLEKLLDMLTKRKSKNFKFLKDAMAAAVLLNSVVAVAIGIIIFGKYLF